jgi:nickel-dependent lactate racemase
MMLKLLQTRGELSVTLPARWKAEQTLFKKGLGVTSPSRELMMRALSRPIRSPRLEEILRADAKVAVVVDDLTRCTPVKDLLPGLLTVIEGEGIPRANVDIVVGVGTHRPMTKKELEARLGTEVVGSYRVENHDARSKDLVVMGSVEDYGSVSFNATVAAADVKVIVGSILPHIHNGFGGGPKNVMPGICNFNTVRRHHMKNVLHPLARVGIVEGNGFLEDTRRIAELARINFAVQCLHDAFGDLYDVLAGDIFSVHDEGIRLQSQNLGVPVQAKTDVSVVSSFPYDEGVQFMKAFMPAAMVTRPGGSIFVVTGLSEPLPDFFLESVAKIKGDDRCSFAPEASERLNRCEPLIEGAAMDFNMAIILVVAVARKFNLCLVGEEVLKSLAGVMGCKYYPDLSSAFAQESAGDDETKTVTMIPAGGYIYPVISEPFYLVDES